MTFSAIVKNKLTVDRLTSASGLHPASYTWDDNGDLLSDGVRSYTYDAAQRLIAASRTTGNASFILLCVQNRSTTATGCGWGGR